MHFPPQAYSLDGQLVVHVPPEHTCPDEQTVPSFVPAQSPEAPQKVRSAAGSMHLPPQSTSPVWHDRTHWPTSQAKPAPQVWPPPQVASAPQARGSFCGSRQVPPQSTSPGWQDKAQAPAEQTWPESQAAPALPPVQAPEAPQNARSVIGSTHLPPQSTRPAAQVTAQAPAEQTLPATQALPHAPQFRLSDVNSTQVPLQLVEAPRHWLWTDVLPPHAAKTEANRRPRPARLSIGSSVRSASIKARAHSVDWPPRVSLRVFASKLSDLPTKGVDVGTGSVSRTQNKWFERRRCRCINAGRRPRGTLPSSAPSMPTPAPPLPCRHAERPLHRPTPGVEPEFPVPPFRFLEVIMTISPYQLARERAETEHLRQIEDDDLVRVVLGSDVKLAVPISTLPRSVHRLHPHARRVAHGREGVPRPRAHRDDSPV